MRKKLRWRHLVAMNQHSEKSDPVVDHWSSFLGLAVASLRLFPLWQLVVLVSLTLLASSLPLHVLPVASQAVLEVYLLSSEKMLPGTVATLSVVRIFASPHGHHSRRSQPLARTPDTMRKLLRSVRYSLQLARNRKRVHRDYCLMKEKPKPLWEFAEIPGRNLYAVEGHRSLKPRPGLQVASHPAFSWLSSSWLMDY